jgi:hypothetical protein
MILIILSRFAIGEVVELQVPLQHCLSWVYLPRQRPFAAASKQQGSLSPTLTCSHQKIAAARRFKSRRLSRQCSPPFSPHAQGSRYVIHYQQAWPWRPDCCSKDLTNACPVRSAQNRKKQSNRFRNTPRYWCGGGEAASPRAFGGIRRRDRMRERKSDPVPGLAPGWARAGGGNSSGAADKSRYFKLNCALTLLVALWSSCCKRSRCRRDLISCPTDSIGMDCFDPSFRITCVPPIPVPPTPRLH